MSDQQERPIGVFQYVTMVAVAVWTGQMYTWPLPLVEVAGSNGFPVLGLGILYMVVSGLVHQAWLRESGQSSALARIGTAALAVSGMILVLVMDAALLSIFGNMLNVVFYAMTPRWALVMPMVGLAAWISIQPLVTIARLAQLWIPLVVGLSYLTVLAGINHIRFWSAVSVGGIHWTGILPESRAMAGILIPFVPMMLLLAPQVNASRQRVRRGDYGLWIVIMGVLTSFYIVGLTVLGPEAIDHLRWPMVYLFATITFGGSFFISRVGVITVFFWSILMILSMIVHVRALMTIWPWRSAEAARPWIAAVWGLWMLGGSLFVFSPGQTYAWMINVFHPWLVVYLAVELVVAMVGVGVAWALRWVGRRRADEAP